MEMMIPKKAHMTDSTAEQIVTLLQLLKSRMADNAGKMTKAEIRSDPTRFMARTIITAITIAISRLYAFAIVPVAVEKERIRSVRKNGKAVRSVLAAGYVDIFFCTVDIATVKTTELADPDTGRIQKSDFGFMLKIIDGINDLKNLIF